MGSITVHETTPSQPPPWQGEEQIESLTTYAEQFPPPWQGEEQIEVLTTFAEQSPPLRRGGLGWGLFPRDLHRFQQR